MNKVSIYETCLYVNRLNKSCKFYSETMGFTLIALSERAAALKVNDDQVLTLFKQGASLDLEQLPHNAIGQMHVAFCVPESEYLQCLNNVETYPLAIEDERSWEHGGRSFYFRDPDGHLIEVATTKGVWLPKD